MATIDNAIAKLDIIITKADNIINGLQIAKKILIQGEIPWDKKEIPCNTTKIIDKNPNTGEPITERTYKIKKFIDSNGHQQEHWIPLTNSNPLIKTVTVFDEDGSEDTDLNHEIDMIDITP